MSWQFRAYGPVKGVQELLVEQLQPVTSDKSENDRKHIMDSAISAIGCLRNWPEEKDVEVNIGGDGIGSLNIEIKEYVLPVEPS